MKRVPGRFGAVGLAACAAAFACARPQQEGTDSATVPAASASAPDTQRRLQPPKRPLDATPWVPNPPPGGGIAPAPDTVRPKAKAPAGGWTAGTVQSRRSGGTGLLRAVRSARNAGWDRVVFEFEGAGLPPYHVEYVDRPVVHCGSGHTVPVAGDGWLQVRFNGAAAHTEEGKVTVAQRERKLTLPVLRELELTCDFEGEVTWVLGVARPNPFRVTELSKPARLVVDVRQ
ncbi:MAG TPA: hypothetical protein VF263_00850 [Longimicrobiaceae bacterium]